MPYFALEGVFVDLVCHRCHMEESEQQVAGLSTWACVFGTMSLTVSLGQCQNRLALPVTNFSPLCLELMTKKKLFLWGAPFPRSLYVRSSLLCTRARGKGPLTWPRGIFVCLKRKIINYFGYSCWRNIAFHFEMDYSIEKTIMWACSIQGWGSSAATTEWDQEVFTEPRCHLPWHSNTQSRRKDWRQVRLLRDQRFFTGTYFNSTIMATNPALYTSPHLPEFWRDTCGCPVVF